MGKNPIDISSSLPKSLLSIEKEEIEGATEETEKEKKTVNLNQRRKAKLPKDNSKKIATLIKPA